MIEIWQPRYHDKKVLIAKYKVSNGMNEIKFTRAKHLKDMVFRIHSMEIAKCPVETNGTIPCYAVPMDKLENISVCGSVSSCNGAEGCDSCDHQGEE